MMLPECLPDEPTNEPPAPEDDNTGDTTGDGGVPEEVNTVPSSQPVVEPEKLQDDLTCGCARAKPAAVAVAQALAAANGDCSSPAGQALAQAFASATASGQGAAFAQAIASAQAVSAQKVSAAIKRSSTYRTTFFCVTELID
jgi:hypothetical protein